MNISECQIPVVVRAIPTGGRIISQRAPARSEALIMALSGIPKGDLGLLRFLNRAWAFKC